MCATCVAQGVVYVGGALAGLQVLGARAKARRQADHDDGRAADTSTAERQMADSR